MVEAYVISTTVKLYTTGIISLFFVLYFFMIYKTMLYIFTRNFNKQ